MRTWRIVLIAILLSWTGCRTTPQAEDSYSGPIFGFALEGLPITGKQIQSIEKDTGLRPELVVFFLQWPADPTETGFPAPSLDTIRNRGALPCLTWEPMYYQNNREMIIPADQILNGTYDAYLTAFAQEAKLWGDPFIIRFAHEMNTNRYHWGENRLDQYGPQSPATYRQMYRHVVDIFRKIGADNVLWAFSPNAESVPNSSYDATASWNRAGHYYPGNDYVDIIGIDGYNWGTTQTMAMNGWQSRWLSFAAIFGPMYKEMTSLAPDKPVLVFETASAEQGGRKDQWIEEAFATATAWNMKGIVWFQADKEVDWRINSSGTSYLLAALKLNSTAGQLFNSIIHRKITTFSDKASQ